MNTNDIIKSNIIFTLVDGKQYGENIHIIAHRSFLDLTVIYQEMIPVKNGKTYLRLLTKADIQGLGLSMTELHELAIRNAMQKMPAEIFRFANEMVVISNTAGIHGAASVLYPEVLEKVAEMEGDDYYLIPSSIHEFIAFPAVPDITSSDLCQMIKEVNRTCCKENEVLSDHGYIYRRKEHRVFII